MDQSGRPTVGDMTEYDVVIIGAGAAGLSAALVLSRARRRVLVVDAGTPRNAPAAHMQGYLSRDGMPPADLLATGRDEIVGYGGQISADHVEDVAACPDSGFQVRLGNGDWVAARRLLVATGLRDELPDLPGLRGRWARDVLHCPYCHGWEVRDRRLGVLANSTPESITYAQIVRQWSGDVVLLVPPDVLTTQQRAELTARNIGVIEAHPTQVLVEDDRLFGLELPDGTVVPCDALFVPPTFVPNDELLVRLGCTRDERGWVVKDATGRTSVPGVWVAGNVANPRAQVITAAGEGSAAAIDLNADLVQEDVKDAVRVAQTSTPTRPARASPESPARPPHLGPSAQPTVPHKEQKP
jgi:thioredoxin reductase